MKKNHLILAALLLSASASHAALIAHYDFSDGKLLDDETGIYDLTSRLPKAMASPSMAMDSVPILTAALELTT